MEYRSIEREIHVDASPEVAFEVVSSPAHISEWSTDDAGFEATPGVVGEFVWGDRGRGRRDHCGERRAAAIVLVPQVLSRRHSRRSQPTRYW
ncbi:hypothetical protein AB0B25_06005 [Nocardia sp. NPDC049190]|uniref:hypothetical protein n=1 Tax=Nocardia sp. NPDC049190 TaxID=3155650 RepID=UPI0033C9419E